MLSTAPAALARAPAKPETPFEKARRLALSKNVKERAAAVQLLRTHKGTGHIDKERALRLYGLTAISLRKQWPDAVKEAKTAFEELAAKGRFEEMRWRGEIGRWEVRLALAQDGLEKRPPEPDRANTELAKLDEEIDRVLARQNAREYAIDIAYLLGQVRETAGNLRGALKAYKHSLHLYGNLKKQRKHYSARAEDYWGLLNAKSIKTDVDRINKILSAKKEPQLSFEKARLLRRQRKYKKARELFDKVAKDYPQHLLGAASGYYAAECSHSLKDYRDCQQRLQVFIEVSPGGSYRGHAHLLLGDLFTLMAFDLNKGSKEYNAVLNPRAWKQWWPKLTRDKPKPATPDESWKAVTHSAHDRLGVVAYFDRRYKEAEEHFKESTRLRPPKDRFPNGVPVGMELVVERVQAGELPRAITKDILRGDRRVAFGLFWAAVLTDGWRYQESLAVLQRLDKHLRKAATADQQAFLCVRFGEAYHSLNREKDAIRHYRQFVDGKWKKSRWGAEACLMYCNLLSARGDSAEADKYMVMSFTRFPNGRWADWAMYQWALIKSWDPKQSREALALLRQALARYPKSDYAPLAKVVVKDLLTGSVGGAQ